MNTIPTVVAQERWEATIAARRPGGAPDGEGTRRIATTGVEIHIHATLHRCCEERPDHTDRPEFTRREEYRR